MNPTRCARTTYGPGGSVSSSKCPARSLTAKALVAPSADTIAPATGRPRSSSTLPRIAPCVTDAICVTGRGWTAAICAFAAGARQRSTSTPTAAAENAVLLNVYSGRLLRSFTPVRSLRSGCAGPPGLRRADRKVHVPRQGLVRDLVGDLDLEAVRPLGERRQRHGLPALQLMPGC